MMRKLIWVKELIMHPKQKLYLVKFHLNLKPGLNLILQLLTMMHLRMNFQKLTLKPKLYLQLQLLTMELLMVQEMIRMMQRHENLNTLPNLVVVSIILLSCLEFNPPGAASQKDHRQTSCFRH